MAVCTCTACRLRRLGGALFLILAGALLLLGMLRPGWSPGSLVGLLLVAAGAWRLLLTVAPRAANHRSPGGFAGLLMLIVGGLIVGHHFYPALPWGAEIARYWPVLLIVWGLVRLVEHYAGRGRRFSGGDVALVMLIVIGGLAFNGAYRLGVSQWPARWGVNPAAWNPFLQSNAYTARMDAPLDGATTVVVRGGRGDLRLVPGAAGTVSASVTDTVYAANPGAAHQLFQRSLPLMTPQDGRLVVMPAGNGASNRIRADLVLTLPPTTTVEVELQHGNIAVQNWQAPLRLRTGGGAMTLGHITGDVAVTAHGAVSCDHITGSLAVTGSGGDGVEFSDVSGPASLKGNFIGNLSFRGLAQGLQLASMRTTLRAATLPGSLDVSPSRIVLNGATEVSATTRDATLVLSRVSGPIELQARNRPVSVGLAGRLTDPVTVSDRNADISLTLPAASAFHLQADTRNGRITADDFGVAVTVNNSDAHADAATAGAPAAAPRVRLETRNGNINVARAQP